MIGGTVTLIIILSLFLSTVGVDAAFADGALTLYIKIGPKRLKLLPADEKKQKKAKPKKEKKPKKVKEKPEGEKAEKGKITLELIMAVIPMALRALGRLRRQISIDILALHYTAGSSDPYDTAMSYGYVNAAVGALYPGINKALKVREWDVRTDMDFLAEKPVIYARLAASFQIWELLYIAFAFGVEFLNYLYVTR